jgi:hypothetical protein
LEDLCLGRSIIIRYILKTWDEDVDVVQLALEIVPGSCEHNNDISVSIKSEEFLDHLGIHQFKKCSAPRSFLIVY